ncbi:hypothetical protein LEP1GSC161_2619 [Leptospira santarosai str. CBC1416]|uniref:Uncharacterized protein n=1 Tax=Leptospira santarosai str. CBC1416 TaxID=1193059 RepID=M6VGG8_9LEPT|nr:hypothetical protein LEP1GSC161_2619 [Leptospira santarosai str. CBC1416]
MFETIRFLKVQISPIFSSYKSLFVIKRSSSHKLRLLEILLLFNFCESSHRLRFFGKSFLLDAFYCVKLSS